MANGSGSCTVGVGNVTSYTSTFDYLDIADQTNNPAGSFNLTQLREQARPLPYVMTELLMNSDIMMLYNNVLPGRPVSSLDFLNDTTTMVTTTTTTTAAASTGSPASGTAPTVSPTGTTAPTVSSTGSTAALTVSATNATVPTISPVGTPPTRPEGGGTTAISYSLFITLAALLLPSVL